MSEMSVYLWSVTGEETRRVTIRHNDADGPAASIRIALEGCGLLEMETGFEEVIVLELTEHGFKLYAWDDINKPNPKVLEFGRAREQLRAEFGGG